MIPYSILLQSSGCVKSARTTSICALDLPAYFSRSCWREESLLTARRKRFLLGSRNGMSWLHGLPLAQVRRMMPFSRSIGIMGDCCVDYGWCWCGCEYGLKARDGG